ncbi:MAG: hypothetical protein GYB66_01020, partial [Chloroflexi bacterium]|nr:hypothetical protein [Chloroflexota bacterium]
DPEAHPVPAQDAVHLIEAPDTSSEVQGVLRRVKSLLLDGHSPEDFIILARNIDDYADLLRAVGNAYGVPLVFRQGTRLSNNPAIVALMNLLGLHNRITDFRRQSVLDVLRSPYFTINDWQPHMTSQLEQISLRFQVIGSREDWFTALENASQIPEDEDGEPLLPPDEAIEIQEMAQGLANFFDRITPPAEGTVNDFIAWIEALMGADPSYQREASADVGAILPEPRLDDLAFFATVRGPALDTQSSYIEQLVLVRDLYALHGLRGCLQDILTGYQILGDDERLISWDQFWIDLQLGIEQRHAEPMGGSYRHGRVLATSAEQGQGLPHDHVFILGLAEGVFPVQRREDPLYSDQERRQFEEITANQYDLQTTLEYQDDTAIFYQCLALARQSVTLSRPILDQNANPWPESILWRAVEDLIEDPVRLRYRVAEPLPINQAATIREVGIALAHASRDGGAAPDRLAHIHDWLLSHPDFGAHWTSVQHGQSIELARLDRRQPHGRYTGVITDQNLQRQVARILGKQRPWSASQFNDFGYCPFRFFAGRLLKLEAQEEPEPGYDPAQLGSLQHFILENTYHEIQQRDLAIHPDNATQALSILKSQADQALPTAPYAFGFRADLWWRQEQAEIRQRLEQLVALDFSAEKNSPFNRNPYSRKPYPVSDITHGQPRYIYALEAPFDRKTEPYAVLQGAAGPLLARGFIDRIDRVGDQLIVIDYKSGSQLPSERDIEEGRNFQMMLYLVAAQQIVARRDPNLQVAAGMFWSIRKPEKSTQIDANDPILGEVQARLHEMVLAGRQGDFRVQPNKFENGKCFKYCEFSQLCRIQQTPRRYI